MLPPTSTEHHVPFGFRRVHVPAAWRRPPLLSGAPPPPALVRPPYDAVVRPRPSRGRPVDRTALAVLVEPAHTVGRAALVIGGIAKNAPLPAHARPLRPDAPVDRP